MMGGAAREPNATGSAALVERARANPGEFVTLRLLTDLKIDVSVQGHTTRIRLSRSTSYPTLNEWAILTKHWPEPIKPYPHREVMYGRCYLFIIVSRTTICYYAKQGYFVRKQVD